MEYAVDLNDNICSTNDLKILWKESRENVNNATKNCMYNKRNNESK